MSKQIDINIQLTAKIVEELRVRPLRNGKFRQGVESKLRRILAMQEAERVVAALHQARANIQRALELAPDPIYVVTEGDPVLPLLFATQKLLKAVVR